MRISFFAFFLFSLVEVSAQDLYYQRGVYSYSLGSYEQAIEDFNQSLAITPKALDTYYYRGHSYLYLGRYDKALKDLKIIDAIYEAVKSGKKVNLKL